MSASRTLPEPPHGVSLEAFAEMSAAVAEGTEPLAAVLAGRGCSLTEWREVSDHYTRLLAADAAGDGPWMEAYTRSFAEAQDRLRPVPELTVEAWADLAESLGARGGEALVEAGLRDADVQRLSRHWARILGRDQAAARRYHAAFFAAAARRRRSASAGQ